MPAQPADVKKLGRVPDGGGWRYVGRQQGKKNRSATAVRTAGPRNKHGNPLIGTCYLHTFIDDHSRVAYVEARDDETKETATEVFGRPSPIYDIRPCRRNFSTNVPGHHN